MGQLKIHKLHYEGKHYSFNSPCLDEHKISIIEAPNGSGKSTFFHLLYYGLGGKVTQFSKTEKVRHPEIVDDKSNMVELEILIDKKPFKLIRKIGENLITVISEEDIFVNDENKGKLVCLPINRNASDDFIFSDWILTTLNIPLIDIYHSGKDFKLGLNDLLRLVYHDQGGDANQIYKPADSINYVSDSSFLRKAIFQVLIGKTLVQLYKAYGLLKKKQSEYDRANALFSEYKNIVSDMYKQLGITHVTNDLYLEKEIERLNALIEKSTNLRNSKVKINSHITNNIGISQTEKIKDSYSENELSLVELRQSETFKKNEIDSLNKIISQTKEDALRLQKIIHTHRQLEMFTPDTCPYCLKNVERVTDKCVCGNEIDENDYQRYFYDPSEYYTLLKSKVKSLETMRVALDAANKELNEFKEIIQNAEKLSLELKINLAQALDKIEYITDIDFLDQIEDQIIHNKELVSQYNQALILERNLLHYQKSKTSSKTEVDLARAAADRFSAAAQQEIIEKVVEFNKYYNKFMKKSLADCRSAEISSEDYMPLINNGEYKEASAAVHKRFLYFVTMLQLSLLDDIPFPRLLLIDTPENIGIDNENLKRLLDCLNDLENPRDLDYQILLSTGEGKYPDSLKKNVVIKLANGNKLLRKK